MDPHVCLFESAFGVNAETRESRHSIELRDFEKLSLTGCDELRPSTAGIVWVLQRWQPCNERHGFESCIKSLV